jgi:molecular chaperone GrpE
MSEMTTENLEQEEILEETVEEVVEEQNAADLIAAALAAQEDKYLRLAAEYDNYRKRTAKEKEALWTDIKADTAAAFLPVYDNLERAMNQPTADEAYKKGVEMTMNQLKEVFSKLGITEIPALGEQFDPNLHNAVMHIENEELGENVISQVFQAGFRCGEKVIRFAMVQVAN